MKFANRTKLVLAESIKELMDHIPLDKITVTQIVNNCGTTRQTFYLNIPGVISHSNRTLVPIIPG